MSLTADDSPIHSSSSDDFAAILDAELDAASEDSPEDYPDDEGFDDEENAEDDNEEELNGDLLEAERAKRRKVAELECVIESKSVISRGETSQTLEESTEEGKCPPHPGDIRGMCIRCGQMVDDESGLRVSYIHQGLKLANNEIARLRDKDLRNLFRHKKLYLVLDLDHTLLNSTRLSDLIAEEEYLKGHNESLPDALKGSLFRLDFMHMMTKLRPFVHTFLKEASKLFEMYIYTMGERPYALEMAKLLDPGDVYFHSRVIAQGDCTQRHQKGLDIVLGQESAVLILDDTEGVWGKHKDNLILMERYHFFASSCRQFGFSSKSLSQQKKDESEDDGALATILKILQRIHRLFFDSVSLFLIFTVLSVHFICSSELSRSLMQDDKDNLLKQDVRQMLKTVRKEVLNGCKIVFSRVFPTKYHAETHHLWRMAEQLGATCSTELDPSVTHVVSMDAGTEKSRWAIKEKKSLVHPRWLEATNYLWQKQPEENFPVSQVKTNDPDSSEK